MIAMCAWGETNARLTSNCADVERSEDRAYQNLAGMEIPTSRNSVFQAANSFAKKSTAA
jgi:hypothetical protein